MIELKGIRPVLFTKFFVSIKQALLLVICLIIKKEKCQLDAHTCMLSETIYIKVLNC